MPGLREPGSKAALPFLPRGGGGDDKAHHGVADGTCRPPFLDEAGFAGGLRKPHVANSGASPHATAAEERLLTQHHAGRCPRLPRPLLQAAGGDAALRSPRQPDEAGLRTTLGPAHFGRRKQLKR